MEDRRQANGRFTGQAKRSTILTSAVLVAAIVLYAPFVINDPDKTYDKMDLSLCRSFTN